MLPDRFNPRLWVRDWLNKPTAAEKADAQSVSASLAAVVEQQIRSSGSNWSTSSPSGLASRPSRSPGAL